EAHRHLHGDFSVRGGQDVDELVFEPDELRTLTEELGDRLLRRQILHGRERYRGQLQTGPDPGGGPDTVRRMDPALRLMTVHAHPDDESSKGAGTVALYRSRGVGTALVCCTGGEAGDILNPAMDLPEVRADIAAVRRAELAKAAEIIGYDEVFMLGYRDSGMPGSPENSHPASFPTADLH